MEASSKNGNDMDPLKQVKQDLITKSKGGCPCHGIVDLKVRDKHNNNYLIELICTKCNNAFLEEMSYPTYLKTAISDFAKAQYQWIGHGYVRIMERDNKHINVPIYLSEIIIAYYSNDYCGGALCKLAIEFYFAGNTGYCKELAQCSSQTSFEILIGRSTKNNDKFIENERVTIDL